MLGQEMERNNSKNNIIIINYNWFCKHKRYSIGSIKNVTNILLYRTLPWTIILIRWLHSYSYVHNVHLIWTWCFVYRLQSQQINHNCFIHIHSNIYICSKRKCKWTLADGDGKDVWRIWSLGKKGIFFEMKYHRSPSIHQSLSRVRQGIRRMRRTKYKHVCQFVRKGSESGCGRDIESISYLGYYRQSFHLHFLLVIVPISHCYSYTVLACRQHQKRIIPYQQIIFHKNQ